MSSIKSLIDDADTILIVQADNPDGDSLASSLALEQILHELGKDPVLFCSVDIPTYLRYLEGWDRVVQHLPHKFDLSIIVDTSSISLLENLQKNGDIKWLKSKPCIVIDHHTTKSTIDFATEQYIEPASSTAELIYSLCQASKWPLSKKAGYNIAVAILSDSLGLMGDNATSKTIRIIAELVENGVSLPKLDSMRKEHQKKQPELLKYKGELLKRIDYSEDGRIAFISIPWEEIEKYSPLYNPSMLVIDEMRQVQKVRVAIAFKTYPNGRITAKIRSNYGYPVCDAAAEAFGGGGHPYASGFRIVDDRQLNEIKQKCTVVITDLLDKIDKENETI